MPSREIFLLAPTPERTFAVAENDEDYDVIDLLLVTSLDLEGP